MMSRIYSGNLASEVSGLDSVTKGDVLEDKLVARYDGFTEQQFKDATDNTPPGEVGVPGFEESHPLSGTNLIIYWLEAFPAFGLEISRSNTATHLQNSMPS